jgi:predicted aspartyl protease
MKRPSVIAALIALATSPAAGAQTQTTAVEAVSGPAQIDKTTQTEDIGFKKDLNDRMTVPVLLSGRGPYRFLVDTGADRTAISRDLARTLNYTAGDPASLHSVTGVSTVTTANVPTLQLTRKEIRNIDAPLLEGANMGADGILGLDSLRSQRILFDFGNNVMSIVPSATPDFKSEPGTIVVQGVRKNGRLILTEATANDHPVTVVIDTGSQVTIGNEALHRALLGSKLLKASGQVDLISVTGARITGDYMFIRDLEIGGIGLKDLAIVFADAHTFKQLKLDKKPALLLGMNAIRAFKKVSIDFASHKLRVVVPETSSLDLRLAAAKLTP